MIKGGCVFCSHSDSHTHTQTHLNETRVKKKEKKKRSVNTAIFTLDVRVNTSEVNTVRLSLYTAQSSNETVALLNQ